MVGWGSFSRSLVRIARRLALFILCFPCHVGRGDRDGPGRLRLPLFATFIDKVFNRQHHAEANKGAWRQHSQQERGVGVENLDAQNLRPAAKQTVGAVKQGAVAKDLAQGAQHKHRAGSAHADRETVQCRQRWPFFGGKGFGAADHDAVGHDKRDENPQRLIEAEGIGVDQHLLLVLIILNIANLQLLKIKKIMVSMMLI